MPQRRAREHQLTHYDCLRDKESTTLLPLQDAALLLTKTSVSLLFANVKIEKQGSMGDKNSKP